MLARLASCALLSFSLLPACDVCESSFDVQDQELAVVLDDLEGSLLEPAEAEAVLDAATVQACWEEHGSRECATLPLRDVLADGATGSETELELDAVLERLEPRTKDACLSGGLELTVEAEDCFSPGPHALPRVGDDDAEDRVSLRLECQR